MIQAFKQIRLTNSTIEVTGAGILQVGNEQVVYRSQTGQFVDSAHTGGFVSISQTGQYITTAQTGLFYPASNPNGYITSAQAGGVSAIAVTGTSISGVVNFTGLRGINVSLSGQYVLISGGDTGQFITTAQTGQFVTSAQTGQYVTTAMTGILGIWTGNQQSFATSIPTGIDFTGIWFPSVFPTTPRTVNATIEVTGDYMYGINIRLRNVSGYTAMFTDTIQESGVIVHTFVSL